MWARVLGRRIRCSSSTNMVQRRFISEIFVSRLSYYTTDEEFEKTFSRFGDIKEARLIRDARTQRPKGYGFIAYASDAEAMKAMKAMDGRILAGRLIFVELAKSNPASQG